MNEDQIQIVAAAKNYVTEMFQKQGNSPFSFHNLTHILQVVNAAEEIANYYQLNDNDHFILIVSAWFHDIGFTTGKAEEHEYQSIRFAANFLLEHDTTPEVILRVSSCILATSLSMSPLNFVEEILCDADLYHLGTNDFMIMNGRLKQEQQAYLKKNFSKRKWLQHDIDFLQSHQYFTDYCRQKLEPKKQEWLHRLRNEKAPLLRIFRAKAGTLSSVSIML